MPIRGSYGGRNIRSSRTARDCRTNADCRPGLSCVNYQCVSGLGSVVGIPGIPGDNGCPGEYDTCSDGTCSQSCGGCCTSQTTSDDCYSVTLNTSPPNNCSGYCWWDDEEGSGCNWQARTGGRINNTNRRNQMRRGGRTRPKPRGRGRKMPGGGKTCGGMNQPPCPSGGYRRGGRPSPRGRGRQMARGGRARPVARGRGRQMARGGRARPVARGRGRQMARGGRAPARRFQAGGAGGQCPAGTDRTADGRCTPMGS